MTSYEELVDIIKKFPFCYATAECMAEWLIANGMVAQKWISVSQQTPKEEVLAANFAKGTHGYKEQIVGYVYEDSQSKSSGYCAESGSEILLNVTHWMPLPKEPI